MTVQQNKWFTFGVLSAYLLIGITMAVAFSGCGEVKDPQGHVIIDNKPPEVNVHVEPHIHLPPRHHPLRPWLDEPKPKEVERE